MSERACASCGAPVDPVRAPVVAILDGAFVYFCSQACKQRTAALSIAPAAPATVETPPPPPVFVKLAAPPDVALDPTPPPPPIAARIAERPPPRALAASPPPTPPPTRIPPPTREPIRPELVSEASSALGLDRTPPPSLARVSLASSLRPSSSRDHGEASSVVFGRWLRMLAAALALGAVGLALVDAVPQTARLALSSIAELALLLVIAMPSARRSRSALEIQVDAHLGAPLVAGITAAGACVALAWGLHLAHRAAGEGTAVAAATWVVLAAAAAELFAEAGTRSVVAEAHDVLFALERPPGERVPSVGETLIVRGGEVVHEDLRIQRGAIVCELWGNPRLRVRRSRGQPVPAGTFVREGEATARVAATGRSRAFARLLTEALERSDHAAPAVRTLQRTAPIVAAAIVAFAIALGLVSRGKLGPTTAAAFAAGASLLIPPARRLAIRDQLRGIVEACRKGAAFRDSESFVRTGHIRTAILAAGGTLLSASPDGCDVEALGDLPPTDVLAMAAALEQHVASPREDRSNGEGDADELPPSADARAAAIVAAARSRGLRIMETKSATYVPGQGVFGELTSGIEVVVGGRALCLSHHVPTAEHEARALELERTGRDVIFVARGGRVVGLLALQVPLRNGALGAILRLHDLEIEPVIMGGASRERLLAIARAIDVENVRPEVLPEARNEEARRVAQSGGTLAVIGHADRDGDALLAADVSVALLDAGATPELASIGLSHDQLTLAVDVLALAQATRARVAATLAVGLAPVVAAALPVSLGLVRATYAPLAAIAATLALGVRDLVAAALPEGGAIEDNEDLRAAREMVNRG